MDIDGFADWLTLNRGKQTITSYVYKLKIFEAWMKVHGHKKITSVLVRKYLVGYKKKGASINSIGLYKAVICQYLRFKGQVKLAQKIKLMVPTPKSPRKYVLPTDSVLRSIVEAAEDPRDKAILEILYNTGLRRGEIVALHKKDYDRKARTLRIQHPEKKGQDAPARFIPVMWSLGPALDKYLDGWHNKSKWLFPGYNENAPIDAHTIYDIVLKYAEQVISIMNTIGEADVIPNISKSSSDLLVQIKLFENCNSFRVLILIEALIQIRM